MYVTNHYPIKGKKGGRLIAVGFFFFIKIFEVISEK